MKTDSLPTGGPAPFSLNTLMPISMSVAHRHFQGVGISKAVSQTTRTSRFRFGRTPDAGELPAGTGRPFWMFEQPGCQPGEHGLS